MSCKWLTKIEHEAEGIFTHAPELKPTVEAVLNELETVVANFKKSNDVAGLKAAFVTLVDQVEAATVPVTPTA